MYGRARHQNAKLERDARQQLVSYPGLAARSVRYHLDVGRTARLVSLLALGLALAACGGTPAVTSSGGSDPLNRGLEAHAAGRLDEAKTAYFEALSKDPQDKYAYYNLGQIAQTQNRAVAAESYYRLALEVDPKLSAALFNLAIVRANNGGIAEAGELYKRVIAVEPNNAAAHFNLGLLLRANGSRTDAEAELARAKELDPKLVAPAVPATSAPPRLSPLPSPTR